MTEQNQTLSGQTAGQPQTSSPSQETNEAFGMRLDPRLEAVLERMDSNVMALLSSHRALLDVLDQQTSQIRSLESRLDQLLTASPSPSPQSSEETPSLRQ